MKDKERVHHDDHFQEDLDSLKVNLAHITSLLEGLHHYLSWIDSQTPLMWRLIQLACDFFNN
jgi:hypothetical protein